MEHLNRKIKRVATLEARLAALKVDVQLEMQRLNCTPVQSVQGLHTDANKKSSPTYTHEDGNWSDCVRNSEIISNENWEPEADRQSFTLGGKTSKWAQSKNWKDRCPFCFANNCEHQV